MQGTALTDVVSFRREHVSRLLNYGIQNDLIPHLAERDLAERGPAISKAKQRICHWEARSWRGAAARPLYWLAPVPGSPGRQPHIAVVKPSDEAKEKRGRNP
jgi:hypothetical protein